MEYVLVVISVLLILITLCREGRPTGLRARSPEEAK